MHLPYTVIFYCSPEEDTPEQQQASTDGAVLVQQTSRQLQQSWCGQQPGGHILCAHNKWEQ